MSWYFCQILSQLLGISASAAVLSLRHSQHHITPSQPLGKVLLPGAALQHLQCTTTTVSERCWVLQRSRSSAHVAAPIPPHGQWHRAATQQCPAPQGTSHLGAPKALCKGGLLQFSSYRNLKHGYKVIFFCVTVNTAVKLQSRTLPTTRGVCNGNQDTFLNSTQGCPRDKLGNKPKAGSTLSKVTRL